MKNQDWEPPNSAEPPTAQTGSTGQDLHETQPSPVSQLLEELSLDGSFSDETTDGADINGESEERSYCLLNREGNEHQDSSHSCEVTPIKQPPAVAQKPKVSLILPFNQSKHVSVHPQDSLSITQAADEVDALPGQMKEELIERTEQQDEEDTKELSGGGETSPDQEDSCFTSEDTSVGHHLPNGEVQEEEEEDEDGLSSTTGSISSKDDDTGESEL